MHHQLNIGKKCLRLLRRCLKIEQWFINHNQKQGSTEWFINHMRGATNIKDKHRYSNYQILFELIARSGALILTRKGCGSRKKV